MRDLFNVLSLVQLPTVSTLRLNSRDYVRNRSTTDDLENSYNLSSFRIDASSEAYECKPREAGVAVTVHRSTTSNFARNKSHHDIEPAFEVPKPVTILTPTCDTQIDTYSICRMQVSPLCKAKVECQSQARRIL